jgi:hypothetical protein
MHHKLLRLFLFLVALTAAWVVLPARAAFHLWSIQELYSNADGSVQFIEFTALTGGQQFLQGHTIVSQANSVTRGFTFPNNLPGDTGGRRFLVGTVGFAALGVVTPDFVVPNGFLFTAGGSITFGEGADSWNYPALPTNGALSLDRSGTTGTNSPTNFAGQTGRVTLTAGPPPPTTSYEGLWWRSPAGSENGWGVNITHQGEILFATWFTYDTDGSGMWLVVPSAVKAQGNTFQGAIYRTTGPSFDTFDASNSASVGLTQVGAATFTFTEDSKGTFSYNVNGVTQTKDIVKQIYAAKVPDCLVGGTAGDSPVFQDLWWRTGGVESGWGVNIAHQSDILFVTWFTYDATRKGLWLVGSNVAKTANNVYSGDLFRTTGPAFSSVPWDVSKITVTKVGTVTLTFADANNGTFAYTVNGVSQSKPIARQAFATPQTVCR